VSNSRVVPTWLKELLWGNIEPILTSLTSAGTFSIMPQK